MLVSPPAYKALVGLAAPAPLALAVPPKLPKFIELPVLAIVILSTTSVFVPETCPVMNKPLVLFDVPCH